MPGNRPSTTGRLHLPCTWGDEDNWPRSLVVQEQAIGHPPWRHKRCPNERIPLAREWGTDSEISYQDQARWVISWTWAVISLFPGKHQGGLYATVPFDRLHSPVHFKYHDITFSFRGGLRRPIHSIHNPPRMQNISVFFKMNLPFICRT